MLIHLSRLFRTVFRLHFSILSHVREIGETAYCLYGRHLSCVFYILDDFFYCNHYSIGASYSEVLIGDMQNILVLRFTDAFLYIVSQEFVIEVNILHIIHHFFLLQFLQLARFQAS